MSFARSRPSKGNVSSTVIPSLPALPKLPSRLQSKRSSIVPSAVSKDVKGQSHRTDRPAFSDPSRDELEDIVNNLSTIVKKSEQLLTPVKPAPASATVRRTASLHLTKIDLDRRKLVKPTVKTSTSHYHACERLHESISDRSSECGTTVSSITRRTSIRPLHNVEKYSGIKCALPSFTSTVPSTFKSLDKHYTPIKSKLSGSSTSTMDNQLTPANTHGKDKSPWRLRFEKFLNHQEPTPISPSRESVALNTTKTSSLGKENRTPSFRLPARRMSRCNLPS